MKRLIGKKLSLFFSSENPAPWSEIGMSGEIIDFAECITGKLLIIKSEALFLLVAPRYKENTFDDISENPLPVHVARYIGNDNVPGGFLVDTEIENLGIATIRFVD